MTKKERIRDVLSNLEDKDLVEAFNEYCRDYGYNEDEFIPMDMFDECFSGVKPLEIVESIGRDFDPADDYWVDGIYGVESYTASECADDVREYWLGDLVDYVIDNGKSLYVGEIDEILKEEEDGEEN